MNAPAEDSPVRDSSAEDPRTENPSAEDQEVHSDESACPLSVREQNQNICLLTVNWGLIYLASPVTYVGTIQASLCERLGMNDRIANIPSSAYLFATALPILVVSLFPRVSQLHRVLTASFAVASLSGIFLAGALVVPLPAGVDRSGVVVAALILHAAVMGCTIGVAVDNQWEVLGRGVAHERRGQALAWVFSLGPLLAVAASLGSQLLLAGRLNGFRVPAVAWLGLDAWKVPDLVIPSLEFPWNFSAVFAMSVPILGLAGCLSSRYAIPKPKVELPRASLLAGLGASIRQFLGYRPILISTVAYILVYSGFMVINNITLYTRQAMDEGPEQSAGLQLALRFAFKVIAGLGLGCLLAWTNPRTLLVTTAVIVGVGVTWALAVPGTWYLLCFGLLGAGELFGVYYPNYILGCSPKSKMRKNMALTSLITTPVGFSAVIYGSVSDKLGVGDRKFGLQASFVLSLTLLALAIALVLVALPARPRPRDADLDASDRPAA
jgi:hypothetical protein